jgi:hypothetical protein
MCVPQWMGEEICSRHPFVRCLLFSECDALFTEEQCDNVLGADNILSHERRTYQAEASMLGEHTLIS